jgi:hypothetical protein
LGEGPQDNEILHHDAIPELVLDEVCVVWASLLEEPLKVVGGRLCLVLATTFHSHDAHRTRAACLFAIASVIVGHGYARLKT